ncbi:uncharacterized protein [Macaca fascicularis]|uniref:uncharacterized protein n=1 Tax=Macaca fascicularis TaxID=9541 RepID=UPI003D157C8B
MRTRVGPTVPGPGSISQVPSPCCTEALALPVTLVSALSLGEPIQVPNRATVVWAGDLESLKGTWRGPKPVSTFLREAVQALYSSFVSVLRFPWAVHVRGSSLSPFSPLVSFSELFHPGGPLASSGIDGEHRGRIALSPLALDQCLSITCSDSRVLNLRSFLSSWSPALSELFPPADPLGLTGIGGDPRGRLAFGSLAPGRWSSSRCPTLVH